MLRTRARGLPSAPATVTVIRCCAGNVSTANAWELGDAQGTVGKRSASSLEVRKDPTKTRKDGIGTETWAGNLVSRRGRRHPAPGRPFSAPATMPPEAQQPPGPAADPPQPQHGTRHHYDRRERHPLRRCGSLCGHRRSSLCTSASPPAACSLTSPPLTASSSPWQGIPSAMLLPPPSTQHTRSWCRSACGDGS